MLFYLHSIREGNHGRIVWSTLRSGIEYRRLSPPLKEDIVLPVCLHMWGLFHEVLGEKYKGVASKIPKTIHEKVSYLITTQLLKMYSGFSNDILVKLLLPIIFLSLKTNLKNLRWAVSPCSSQPFALLLTGRAGNTPICQYSPSFTFKEPQFSLRISSISSHYTLQEQRKGNFLSEHPEATSRRMWNNCPRTKDSESSRRAAGNWDGRATSDQRILPVPRDELRFRTDSV